MDDYGNELESFFSSDSGFSFVIDGLLWDGYCVDRFYNEGV